MVLYTDGLLEVVESNHPGWVAINWLYPGKDRFTALKHLRQLQDDVKAAGFKGWLAYSEWQYKNMHKVLYRLGCWPYAADAKHIYFKKEVN